MTGITSTSIIAVFSIVITVVIMCSTLFAGVAGAQLFPIFFTSFAPFNSFFFGNGFVSFFDRTNVRFPIHSHDFGRSEFNTFRKTAVSRPISGGIGSATVKRPGAVGGGFATARRGGGRMGGGRR